MTSDISHAYAGMLSPEDIAKTFSFTMEELAGHGALPPSTMRMQAGSPKVQGYLRDVMQVLEAANEAFGDHQAAISWMVNDPVPAFRRNTAFALIREGRARNVIAYLGSIESGFVG